MVFMLILCLLTVCLVGLVVFAVVYLGSCWLLCLVDLLFGGDNCGWFAFRCLLFDSPIDLAVFDAVCLWRLLWVFVYGVLCGVCCLYI